jgi:prepilin-type N-terminal cleavage/methylation domain-containing protein
MKDPGLIQIVIRMRVINLTMNNMHNKGFTLVELMVVMTIICILAGMSLMSLRGFQNTAALEQSANDLKFELAQASLSAIRQNRNYTMVFAQPDHYSYQLWTVIGGVSTLVDSFRLKTGTSFTNGVDTAIFSNSGAVLQVPDSIKIVKENRNKRITILSATGEVIIQ